MRLLMTTLLCALGTPLLPGQTEKASGTTKQFASDSLNLRLQYPAMLEARDGAEAMVKGHLAMPGLLEARVEANRVAGCLRPVLLLRTAQPAKDATTTEQPANDGSETTVRVTPAASGTMLLAELDPTCLSETEQVSGRKELPVMAQQFLATPGMAAVRQPATYTIGWQKVTMAAAQGHPQTPAPAGADPTQQPTALPFTIFTMAIATNWNSHLLVWLMSANQISLLDAMSKSTVRFGRGAEAPLYPLTMGNGNGGGTPQ